MGLRRGSFSSDSGFVVSEDESSPHPGGDEACRTQSADWTTRIGIREDSRLYEDMILAQGAMALLLSMRTPEARAARSLAVFDGLTWVWPFCGG